MMLQAAPKVGEVQIQDVWDFDEDKRFGIIDVINRSLGDENWVHNTDFITRRYLKNPGNSQVFTVAKLFDEVVGYVIVRKDYDDKTSYLSFVAVNKNYHGNNIGSILLEDAIEKVKNIGVTTLVFDCRVKVKDFYCKFAEKHDIVFEHEEFGTFDNRDKKICFTYYLSQITN